MSAEVRSWWENCTKESDKEIRAIDAIEDRIAPLDDQTAKIRQRITSLELCHHKAERHVELIMKAIGSGDASKGSGRRPALQRQPVVSCRQNCPWEDCYDSVWQHGYDALSAWSSGSLAEAMHLDVRGIPAGELVSSVGDPTPLKVWQGQRIMGKVRSFLNPSFRYVEIGEYGEDSEFRSLTMQTIIHDTVDGQDAEVPLAAAIDNLCPCHWDFVGNLVIVLKAIGGDLFPEQPFAACGRNIKLTPIRDKMRRASNTLRAFWEERDTAQDVDAGILRILGARTPVKHWLAASLDKTIRLQLCI